MAQTNESLLVVQQGKQTVWGTGVAATAKLRGLTKSPKFSPLIENEVLEDLDGYMGPGDLAVMNATGAGASIPGYVTYEDFQYWLDSLFGLVTPTGAGPYVYACAGPLGTPPASPRIMSLEYGDVGPGTAGYRMIDSLVSKLTVQCENKKTATYTADLIGSGIAPVTMTGALTLRTVQPVHASHFAVYIDAWGGTMGTTLLATTGISFEYTIDAKRALGYFFGNLGPGDWDESMFDVELKLTMKFNTTSKAEFDAAIGNTIAQKQIRLKATSGTKIFQQDFAVTYIGAPQMWEVRNGAAIVTLSGKGTYNTALANYFKSSITNSVAALP